MATGDFGWLKLQLAFLAGRNNVSELDANPLVPSDSLLAGQCVNEAYLEVYTNATPTGKRPGWALQTLGCQYGAPDTGSVTVTLGSNTFSALAGVTADMAGSVINIGQGFYQLASPTQTVEPIAEPSGSTGFTLWHNSKVLDVSDIEIEGGVMVLGWGLLRPMNGRTEAVRWRQITYGDFWSPQVYGAGQLTSVSWPGGVSNPTGDPIFYYIDNSVLVNGAAIAPRMVIWPLPTQRTTLSFQGWVMPGELEDDADRPILPADLVTRCLLPIARERWVKVYKKFTGGNQQWISEQAEKARRILNLTDSAQREKPVRIPLRNC